jgi:redox-sensitive bicupin YhaK (pirin superfamily)
MNGRKIEYPPTRYEDIVLINPANFGWVPDPGTPGTEWKQLGVFSERFTKIAFARLETGAHIQLGSEPSNEIAFVVEGTISVDGVKHETLTAFGTAAEDKRETLTAGEATTLFYIKMPTF